MGSRISCCLYDDSMNYKYNHQDNGIDYNGGDDIYVRENTGQIETYHNQESQLESSKSWLNSLSTDSSIDTSDKNYPYLGITTGKYDDVDDDVVDDDDNNKNYYVKKSLSSYSTTDTSNFKSPLYNDDISFESYTTANTINVCYYKFIYLSIKYIIIYYYE
jgi:hypothetical protein